MTYLNITNIPSTLVPGQHFDFNLSYQIDTGIAGKWVRFRICNNGLEIASNNEYIYYNTGTISVGYDVSALASGSLTVKAEVTDDYGNDQCGDPEVIVSSQTYNIPITGDDNNNDTVPGIPTKYLIIGGVALLGITLLVMMKR